MKSEIEEMDSDEHRCLIGKDMVTMLERVESPKLDLNCCICKVPPAMREVNEAVYTPKVVSIGPLHHGEERLEAMEKLKLRYLKNYLKRTKMKLDECIGKLMEKERHIRSCYMETISQSSDELVKMILIDACFIIEYFFRFFEIPLWKKSDPIISKPSLVLDIHGDLILLENQVPFYVLEDMFTLTVINGDTYSSFLQVSFKYFRSTCDTINGSENDGFTFDYFCQHYLKEVQHLTDLLRMLHIPCHEPHPIGEFYILKHLYSASLLSDAGVNFMVNENKSLLKLQFEKGVLKIPRLVVDYGTEALFSNMVALEQCHYSFDTYISDYMVLLDFLIKDNKDADILVKKGILIGRKNEVIAIFNTTCRGLALVTCNADYLNLCKNLNDFYEKPLHRHRPSLKRDYFSTPWKTVSSIAAIVLLLLTLIQTINSTIPLF